MSFHSNAVLQLELHNGVKPVEAVVFDLDGTLYSKSQVKKVMLKKLCFSIFKLKKFNDCRKAAAGDDFGEAEVMFDAVLDRLASGGFELRRSVRRERWRVWLQQSYYPALLEAVAAAEPRPGMIKLLGRMAGCGIKLAVVSDYGYVPERLESLGFNPSRFDLLLGTEELGAMKPAPRIARIVLDCLKVKADRVLVVGDRADTDQALAADNGMLFLGITDKTSNKTDCADSEGQWISWDKMLALFSSALCCGQTD